LLLGAALLFQCVLLQGIGVCPLGERIHDPKRIAKVAATLGGATFATILITALVQQHILHPADLDYFDTFAAVICSALSAQTAILILQRTQQFALADRNTATLLIQIGALGTALAFNQRVESLMQSTQHAMVAGISFAVIYVLLAALRERLKLSDVPLPFRGTAIHLISAGLIALALMGFAGLM
jgi:electron transport complex protein RnfA